MLADDTDVVVLEDVVALNLGGAGGADDAVVVVGDVIANDFYFACFDEVEASSWAMGEYVVDDGGVM